MTRALALLFALLVGAALYAARQTDKRETLKYLAAPAVEARTAVTKFDTAPDVPARLKACMTDAECVVVSEKRCCDLLHAAVNREGAEVFKTREPAPPCAAPCADAAAASYAARCSSGVCWLVE